MKEFSNETLKAGAHHAKKFTEKEERRVQFLERQAVLTKEQMEKRGEQRKQVLSEFMRRRRY